jgi:hypothetical protein
MYKAIYIDVYQLVLVEENTLSRSGSRSRSQFITASVTVTATVPVTVMI